MNKHIREIAKQISSKLPTTRQVFDQLVMPTAYINELGFCMHDYTMSSWERFRDCLSCIEHVCIKGDHQITRIKERSNEVQSLKLD